MLAYEEKTRKVGVKWLPVSNPVPSAAREAEERWCYNSIDSSGVECQPPGNSVTTEAEESPLLLFVTRKRLVKADSVETALSNL
jgi:hypothetical protein